MFPVLSIRRNGFWLTNAKKESYKERRTQTHAPLPTTKKQRNKNNRDDAFSREYFPDAVPPNL